MNCTTKLSCEVGTVVRPQELLHFSSMSASPPVPSPLCADGRCCEEPSTDRRDASP